MNNKKDTRDTVLDILALCAIVMIIATLVAMVFLETTPY